MKLYIFLLICMAVACTSPATNNSTTIEDSMLIENVGIDTNSKTDKTDSIIIEKEPEKETSITKPDKKDLKVYNNARFKNVTVESIGNKKFRVKGKGQIFEAAFSWVIEDGHNELKKGFEMTEAGAPEWGNFNFVVEANKLNQHSTLHLILFEISAKDGSRQHMLPIKLY